jgi:hypothetical protein
VRSLLVVDGVAGSAHEVLLVKLLSSDASLYRLGFAERDAGASVLGSHAARGNQENQLCNREKPNVFYG